jgi:glyoxylase-like metal-dependent hydrolase (beta-lactamase superfamily II)
MNLRIEAVPLGPFETNAYLLTAEGSKECVVVDAPKGAGENLLGEIKARGLTPTHLFITHGHWDHMCDAADFKAASCKIIAHLADQIPIEQIETVRTRYQSMLPWLTDEDFRSTKVDRWVDEDDTVEALGLTFEIRHVPGHCPGSILFYNAQEKVCFVGDAIFKNSVGRTDLPGGNWNQLLQSIRTRIYTLPDDTHLLPGHGDTTTVGAEKTSNPYAKPA